MTRLLAAMVLLSLASTARADVGVPWLTSRPVPVRVTITADAPPRGVGLLLVPNDPGRQSLPAPRPLRAGTPEVLESDGRRFSFEVYTIPADALAAFEFPRPGLDGNVNTIPDRHHVGGAVFTAVRSLFDGRAVIEEAYHVERQGESMHLRKVSDNAPSWWQSGSCSLTVLSAVIALIWLGVRQSRSRSMRAA